MSSTRALFSDMTSCFSQSERALYGNFIINMNGNTYTNTNKKTINTTTTTNGDDVDE